MVHHAAVASRPDSDGSSVQPEADRHRAKQRRLGKGAVGFRSGLQHDPRQRIPPIRKHSFYLYVDLEDRIEDLSSNL